MQFVGARWRGSPRSNSDRILRTRARIDYHRLQRLLHRMLRDARCDKCCFDRLDNACRGAADLRKPAQQSGAHLQFQSIQHILHFGSDVAPAARRWSEGIHACCVGHGSPVLPRHEPAWSDDVLGNILARMEFYPLGRRSDAKLTDWLYVPLPPLGERRRAVAYAPCAWSTTTVTGMEKLQRHAVFGSSCTQPAHLSPRGPDIEGRHRDPRLF